MPKYLGALTIVLLLGMVLTRISVLRRQGIKAMKFGSIDKTDFLIPPFALFYFYVLFAAAFHWPTVTPHQFFQSEIIAWTGVLFCLAGLLLFLWSLISFRQSFRVGIDADHPDRLITDGVFAFRRSAVPDRALRREQRSLGPSGDDPCGNPMHGASPFFAAA
jgi:protein-S-isoprenylcysteine O-methyltransferase Ste14